MKEVNPTNPSGRTIAQTLKATLPEAWRYRRYWTTDFILAATFIVASLMLSYSSLDLRISELFYHGGGKGVGWPLGQQLPWRVFYYAPSIVVALIVPSCLVYLVISFMHVVSGRYRIHCVFLLVALWLGSVLIVEGILKMNCGRPRPCEIIDFDECRVFVKALSRGIRGCGRSFPCGHSAIGYYLSAFYFLFRRAGWRKSSLILTGSLVLGTLVGIARIADGGHFASDVAWSCSIMFAINLMLYYFVLNVPAHEDGLRVPTGVRGRRVYALLIAVATIVVVELAIYAAAPIQKDIRYRSGYMGEGAGPGTLRMAITNASVDLTFCQSGPLRIEGDAMGYGWPGAVFDVRSHHREVEGRRQVEFICAPRGRFYRNNTFMKATVPLDALERLVLDAEGSQVRISPGSLLPQNTAIQIRSGRLLLPAQWEHASLSIAGPGSIKYLPPPSEANNSPSPAITQ